MNEENITRITLDQASLGATNLAALQAMTDEQIDFSDIPEDMFDSYIMVDIDAKNWLKSNGLHPQQYINKLIHQQMQQSQNQPPA